MFSSNDLSLESTVDKSPWLGDAKPLNNLITSIEVSTAIIHKLHTAIKNLIETVIIPINKIGKPKVVENTRPIQLLSVQRKILSRILLSRIQQKVLKYVNSSQRGCKPHSSTTDIIWTYRWLFAYVENLK